MLRMMSGRAGCSIFHYEAVGQGTVGGRVRSYLPKSLHCMDTPYGDDRAAFVNRYFGQIAGMSPDELGVAARGAPDAC